MSTDVTRRSFVKLSAAAGAAALLGTTQVNNLVESDKAYAEDEVKIVGTYCKACILACAVNAEVRNGRVVRLEGNPNDCYSRGRMCPKGLSGIQALYHPNRTKYPMKRVGERGVDNKWERITWDEGITMVAEALIEMRDKTGRNGLLCTTGGGGNPDFMGPIAFRGYWGAGNVFEPGCAQCAMPRDWIMAGMFGGMPTFPSMADGQARELFNPNMRCECFVIWGTGPAQSGPAQPGRACVELREAGCKTVVVDPRFTGDAARADVWLPIRPGTDVAMMLGWLNYILENDLYNKEFIEKWSNLPYLVDPRDPAGALLRASEVKDMDVSKGEAYVFYDKGTKEVTKSYALSPENEDSYKPALWGTYEVTLKNGKKIKCKTAGTEYRERVAEWTLEKTAETCWVDVEDLEKAIKMYASAASGGISLGVATDQHPQSVQAGEGVCALNLLMGFIEKPGCPITTVAPSASKYQMGVRRGNFMEIPPPLYQAFNPNNNEFGYEYEPKESRIERFGYVEHKGFGCWQHSHIPTTREAILTGEPYQPHVWIERSGNKMATLGDSSSWIEAFKKMDLICHSYMYPTSFTFEAADIIFPVTEWLESVYYYSANVLEGFHSDTTILFEHCDDRFTWGTLLKKLGDLGDENSYHAYYVEQTHYAQCDFEQYKSDLAIVGKTYEETKEMNPWVNCTEQEFWDSVGYEKNYLGLAEDGTYLGFFTKPANGLDITDTPKKVGIYNDRVIYVGRHGEEAFEMPAASEDYQPVPYYWEPSESPLEESDYPLVLTEGRLPFVHHTTLRNIPYIREMYPAPELWIDPEAAAERGIENGDWVNIKSRRCENNEYIADGIYAVAYVTEGIAHGCVYMERWWNPEFLEEGKDPRKSWTTCNVNVLTKKDPPYNPECGSYTLRGFTVQVTKAERPEGIWYEPEDFEPWMPQPSENTGGGYQQ